MRIYVWLILVLFCGLGMAEEKIVVEKKVQGSFVEWVNITNEPDILGVGASKESSDQYWSVFVSVAEFVRKEPLETEFRNVVNSALSRVSGVTSVEEEDREVWLVSGDVEGQDLVIATVKALRTIHPKLRANYADLL